MHCYIFKQVFLSKHSSLLFTGQSYHTVNQLYVGKNFCSAVNYLTVVFESLNAGNSWVELLALLYVCMVPNKRYIILSTYIHWNVLNSDSGQIWETLICLHFQLRISLLLKNLVDFDIPAAKLLHKSLLLAVGNV